MRSDVRWKRAWGCLRGAWPLSCRRREQGRPLGDWCSSRFGGLVEFGFGGHKPEHRETTGRVARVQVEKGGVPCISAWQGVTNIPSVHWCAGNPPLQFFVQKQASLSVILDQRAAVCTTVQSPLGVLCCFHSNGYQNSFWSKYFISF